MLSALEEADPLSLRASLIHETPAMLPQHAPVWWDRPYLNQVVLISASPDVWQHPEALLLKIKAMEKNLGRVERGRWGPREIDIDILAIEGVTHASPTLTIPHAAAHLRRFVLEPLNELWPDCLLAGEVATSQARLDLGNT